jgi:hypothetical protein
MTTNGKDLAAFVRQVARPLVGTPRDFAAHTPAHLERAVTALVNVGRARGVV